MDKKKSELIQYLIIVVLALVIVGILFYMIPYRYNLNTVVTYDADYTYIDNPLMGYAPMADNEEQCEQAKLVFIELTWAEWEPQKGSYDIKGLERRCNIERWKSENKHAVLRFVCDIPGDTDHIDIPQWLYNTTGNGTKYNNSYGKGYSPDYSDKRFMEYHKAAIEALAEYCNQDSFVSFVELGSIGHWGEWHATGNGGKNIMPDADICLDYANHYTDSFADVVFLTRRNYDFAVENGMGVYNDMTGAEADTREWLGWIEKGDSQETEGDDLVLAPLKLHGQAAPVGGEFTSSIPMEEMFGDDFGEILSLISDSNMTFIGPKVPDLLDDSLAVDRKSILRRMGYRIYISKLETQYDFGNNILNASFVWKNAGNAGFFFDWPVTMNIFDADGKLIYWQSLDIDLRELNGGNEKTVLAKIPYNDELREEFYIGISIDDYEQKEKMRMAIEMEEELGDIDGSQIIYHYKRK